MWNARDDSQIPAAINIHIGNDSARAATSRAGSRSTASPWANVSTNPATIRASRAGSSALDAQGGAAEPLGVPREREQHRDAGHRGERRHAAADFDTRQLARIAGDHAGADGEHEGGKQEQHGGQIEQPFQHDRGERRRRVHAFALGQQVRPDHLAGTRRKEKARRKPDDRRRERVDESCRTDRRQERLPAPRAPRVRQPRHHDREHQQSAVGPARFRPDARQIGVSEGESEQTEREQQDEYGANAWPHA